MEKKYRLKCQNCGHYITPGNYPRHGKIFCNFPKYEGIGIPEGFHSHEWTREEIEKERKGLLSGASFWIEEIKDWEAML